MTPTEARKLWSDALRSGDYKQTKQTLCDVGEQAYCCLGVACEVYQQHVGDLVVEEVTRPYSDYADGKSRTVKSFDGSRDYLPAKVAKWLDINGRGQLAVQIPYELHYDHGAVKCNAISLAWLNDSARFDFTQIADVIDSGNVMPEGKEVFQLPLPSLT